MKVWLACWQSSRARVSACLPWLRIPRKRQRARPRRLCASPATVRQQRQSANGRASPARASATSPSNCTCFATASATDPVMSPLAAGLSDEDIARPRRVLRGADSHRARGGSVVLAGGRKTLSRRQHCARDSRVHRLPWPGRPGQCARGLPGPARTAVAQYTQKQLHDYASGARTGENAEDHADHRPAHERRRDARRLVLHPGHALRRQLIAATRGRSPPCH